MAKVLVTEGHLNNIAEAIRSKNGAATTYRPGDMADAIEALDTSGIHPTGTKQITANGTTDVTNYASANVQVPNTYEATDEGKVVSNGALVAQTSRTVTANGTYDTTENDEVVVNVSGGGSTLITKTITQNGTYNANADNADGYSQVIVDVQGGGSANIEEWDLTQSLTGELHGITMNAYNTAVSSEGIVFDSASDYLMIPMSWDGITIEVDVAAMNLTRSNHRRFIMATDSNGFIYRSTGVWAFYNDSWENSNETDGSFFDGCTVKVVVDANGYWHIYKDGVLWWEPMGTQTMSGTTRQIRIGSNSNSINSATITGVRLS